MTYPRDMYVSASFFFIIIKKERKGRLIKHVPFGCWKLYWLFSLSFFKYLYFMIFYNFPKEGAMKYRLQKKKGRTVPHLSAGGHNHLFLLLFIRTHTERLYTHTPPLVFTRNKVLKWWGYFTSFLYFLPTPLLLPDIHIVKVCVEETSLKQIWVYFNAPRANKCWKNLH